MVCSLFEPTKHTYQILCNILLFHSSFNKEHLVYGEYQVNYATVEAHDMLWPGVSNVQTFYTGTNSQWYIEYCDYLTQTDNQVDNSSWQKKVDSS